MATRTIEEIQDALDAIVDPNLEADDVQLDDAQTADVEALLVELEAAKARKARVDALTAKVREGRTKATPALITKERDSDPDAELNAAFRSYLRTGKENADIQELRAAQSEGVPSEGGFLVPPAMRMKIVEKMKAFGGLAGVVDEIVTDSGNSLPWPTLDDTANVGEVVDEGGTFSGGADLVFGQDELVAYSYMAGGANGLPLRLSRELVQDSGFDIEGRVSSALGTRMARIQAQHLVTGTGVAQPKGITTGKTGVAMYGGASDALVYADFLRVVHSLDPAYREMGNCRWAFNDTFLQALEGVLDLNGRPLIKDAAAGANGAPSSGTILGYPFTIDQGFASPSVNSGTVNFGVFGDLRESYIIRRVRNIEILVNPWARMSNRQIEYSAWARMDAQPQNNAAYVTMTGTP